MTESIFPHSVDSLFTTSSVGSLDRALANNLYGINHTQTPGMVSSNRDHQGYLFMTRPQLNLQVDNLRNIRELYPLLTGNPDSLGRYIRMLLDPRLGVGYRYKKGKDKYGFIPPLTCPLIDNNNCFIPFITNNLISCSGWPDETIQTHNSDAGLYKQVFTTAEGVVRHFGNWDLTLNIQNIMGDPASLMLHTWLHYMSAVKEGRMDPYHDYILNDRLDYNTRIYRLVVDHKKEKVTKIMACIAGFPTSNPTGMFGDFNRDLPFSTQTKELSVRINCTGFVVYDPLLVKTFNQSVGIFNTAMRSDKVRETNMIRLSRKNRSSFKNRVYPRIDPDTMDLEWWVTPETYQRHMDDDVNKISTYF